LSEPKEVLPRSIPAQEARDRVPTGEIREGKYAIPISYLRQPEDVIRLQVDEMLRELDADYTTERVVVVIEPPTTGTSLLAGHVVIRVRSAIPPKENA